MPRIRTIVIGLAVVLAAGLAWRLATERNGAKRPPGNGGPVSVVVATAKAENVPVYLDGLGTVQAYNTVTVRAQVNGELTSIDFKEGETVKAGQVLARIDPRLYQAQYDQDKAIRDRDRAQLAQAKSDLARYLSLGSAVSAQIVSQTRSQVAQLVATVSADQASMDSAATQLGYTTITAPITGRAGLRQVDAGNIVHTTDTNGIVVLTQMQPIAVLFSLPQQDLPQVIGRKTPLPVLAVEDDGEKVIDRGHLETVDNQVDSTTGTIRLKAVMPNPDLRLWPGAFVNVRLLVRTVHDGIVVPATAIRHGPEGAYVFLVGADRTVSMRPVTVAQIEGGRALVSKGLAAGATVVSVGAGKLKDGAKVIPAPAGGSAGQ